MGRWANKLENMPRHEPTEPTEISFVSSVGASCDGFSKNKSCNNNLQTLSHTLDNICGGMNIESITEISHLLSDADKQDFADGLLTMEGLHCAIKYWVSIGMPRNYMAK